MDAKHKCVKDSPGRAPQSFFEAATDFERSKTEMERRSKVIAWRVAAASLAATIFCASAFLVAMLFRSEPEPVVLKVNQDGATTMLRALRDGEDHYGEVVDKYWLGQYVRACESYDWNLISEDLEACKLMSDAMIASAHDKTVRAADAPLELLKDKGKIVVKVSSIVLLKDSAQVRFTSEKLGMSGENFDNSPVQKWIATIVYQFEPSLRMTDQQRLVNPLGFKVYSYRVDPEVIR